MNRIYKAIDHKEWRKRLTLPFEKRHSRRIYQELLKINNDISCDFTLYQKKTAN